MSEAKTRIERDSMGTMEVPDWALWGASTQRAVLNFPVSGRRVPVEIIHAYGRLKAACACVNRELGKLPAPIADAIIAAAGEVADGRLDEHFPVDVYQTGSGTSTNMNVNEVIAHRAMRINQAGSGDAPPSSSLRIHPNDHVNMGQSSNDTFPTAMYLASSELMLRELTPAAARCREILNEQAQRWDDVIKIGRTHLMDATPIRMGQVFSGYGAQIGSAIELIEAAAGGLRTGLAIGGTAVGTGVNTHPRFGALVTKELERIYGIKSLHDRLTTAANAFAAQSVKDRMVAAHGQLKTFAVSLTRIANDIRLLGSGPRGGLGELILPAIQPGSSIMPGKVNPVICESVIQVCCRVIGNDAVITTGGLGGVGSLLELNVAMPVMADAMIESIRLLTGACRVMADKLLTGLEVNRTRCAELVERSLMMVTPLATVLGYDTAARLAKEAHESGKTIRQLVREYKLLDDAQLDELLDARKMTGQTTEKPLDKP